MSTQNDGRSGNKPNSTANTASNQTNSTTTVVVYCKYPNGFLMENMADREDPDYRAIGLKGINHMLVVGAQFGITEGVPKDFFEAWKGRMKKFKMIRNGIIYAAPNLDEGKAMVNALTSGKVPLKSGLEPLSPTALPKNLSDLQGKVTQATAGAA